MSFIAFSDLHVHNFKMYSNIVDRTENALQVLTEVFELANSKGITTITFSGDLFHVNASLPTIVVNETIKRFKALFKKYPTINIVAISGNHDHSVINLFEKPAPTALEWVRQAFPRNFHLIDNKTLLLDGVLYYGLPYYKHEACMEQALESLLARDTHAHEGARILLMHQTPAGISDKRWLADMSPQGEDFLRFDLVLCGHIHKMEVLSPKFIVVGSPIQQDAADAGEEKGIFLIDYQRVTKKEKKKFAFEFRPSYICLRNHPRFERQGAKDSGTFFEVRTKPRELNPPKRLTNEALIDAYLVSMLEEENAFYREIGLELIQG